jgi:hypothetical protein
LAARLLLTAKATTVAATCAKRKQFMESSLLAVFGTLAGTVLGFGLNEASYLVRARREERHLLGRVLKELLEIRNQTKIMPTLMETLKSRIPAALPPAADFAIRQMFRDILSGLMQGIQERYNQAVSEVSGAFPVLAYELTAKDILVPLLRQFASLVPATDATAVDFWIKLEEELTRTSLPVLEDLIRRIASMCGRTIRKETDEVLTRQFELPKSTDKFLSQFLSEIAKTKPPATPPGTPPAG